MMRKWILAAAAAIVTLGGAAGVIGEYTGWERPWPLRAELRQTEAQLILAADERRDLYYRQWGTEAELVQRQLWQNQREQRAYQAQRQPVPDSLVREQRQLEQQLMDARQQRQRFLKK